MYKYAFSAVYIAATSTALKIFAWPLSLVALFINIFGSRTRSSALLTPLIAMLLLGLLSCLLNDGSLVAYLISFSLWAIFLHSICSTDYYSKIRGVSVESIFSGLRYFLLFSGIVGLVQFALAPGDDAAIAFYGRSGLQTHGLSILYGLMFLTILGDHLARPSTKTTLLATLFISFFISCFYGFGLFCFGIAIICALITKINIKSIGIILAVFLLIISGFAFFNPTALAYNFRVAGLFFDAISTIYEGGYFDESFIPRKLLVWLNYISIINENWPTIFLGVGPGGFNSRTAFFLNGDYASFGIFPIAASAYHYEHVFPLWNSSLLSTAYTDGSMNQPFSSFLALLSEYGLVVVLVVSFYIFKAYKKIVNAIALIGGSEARWRAFSFKASFWFIIILMLVENIAEYPEILIYFSILISYLIRFDKKSADVMGTER